MDLLRIITCGSVDDGKSTLIGRLLHDAGAVPEDQVAAMVRDSAKMGHAGGEPDYALLLDGLVAERDQGITIDVAYRYFATERRKFIVADAPGHEQYTRNMVTGASNADVAIVLVDARKGVLTQTRRHSYLVSLLGIWSVILAVTKMDRIDWSQDTFEGIVDDYGAMADGLGLADVVAIPVAGLSGDNVVERSARMDWYSGPTLLACLETLPARVNAAAGRFRMPVQGVVRPNADYRGYSGLIACGEIRPGDVVRIQPSGQTARVGTIDTFDGALEAAKAGQSVTLTLDNERDVTRGDVIVAADAPLDVADQFEATVVWMDDHALLPGRVYDLKLATATVSAQVTDIRHQINVNTLEKLAARTLELNAIGVVHLSLGREVAFAPYAEDRTLGGFILIDRETQATLGAGMIGFALRRAANIHRQDLAVSRDDRARLKGQKPTVVWLTGLSGAGKSTIANALDGLLMAEGRHTALIDGDNLRHGLCRDLGFTEADRVENVRRAAETARLMADAGLIVLVSLISPFRADRDAARALMGEGEFFEVFVDVPLAVAEQRDPKGLYVKARAGNLINFTGIDSPYQMPRSPEVHVNTDQMDVLTAARAILEVLRQAGCLRADLPAAV